MSSIEHPFIDPFAEFEADNSPARILAEEAVEVLATYGHPVSKIEEECDVTRLVTERIDITGRPDDTVATALRLKRVSLATVRDTAFERNSSEGDSYIVLSLELGKIACDTLEGKDVFEVSDQDYTWEPYVLIVNESESCEADILDAKTGESLNTDDILNATTSLQFMHRALRFIRHEEILTDDDTPIRTVSRPLPSSSDEQYSSFDPEDTIMTNYAQHLCGPECASKHQQTMQN